METQQNDQSPDKTAGSLQSPVEDVYGFKLAGESGQFTVTMN